MREEDLLSWSERIAAQAAHLDAALHRLLTDLRAFDRAGGPWAAGARSAAHWRSWRVGWDMGTAREHMRVAHALASLPLLDGALERGELSYSKLRAMTRVATPENEPVLLDYARATTAAQLETICKKYATVQNAAGKSPRVEDRRRQRFVTTTELPDGRVRITVVVMADEAALVSAALDHEAKRL